MKSWAALALAACAIQPVFAQTNVDVSIGINQPGVYGRINIGDVPRPALVYARPVIINAPVRAVAAPPPVYLYVPPAEQQNWRRYCGRYQACGQPVYFVRDHWVRERYEREHPGWARGHDKHRGDDHRGGHDDRDHDRGHGHDKGRGKGHDKH